jgi:Spy/CpxP family protein refolding chaperone
MKNYHILLLLALMFVAFAPANAQELDDPQANAAKQPDFRANALRQLGLTRDQLQRIRRLNQERKPRMDEAQMRLRRANRALDEAIYSDSATDAEIEERLKEFQAAQAAVVRIRFMGELGVRRILTPEQLMRFRGMRQRFEQSRANSAPVKDMPVRPAVNRGMPPTQLIRSGSKKP